MILNLLTNKLLARKSAKARAGPQARLRPQLKQRQLLPTLPKAKLNPPRFQDDNSPAGFRIKWFQ